MDNEMMSIDERTKTVENGIKIVGTPKSCDEHVFKKARFAWQIKGQLNTENNHSKGEASCVRSECEENVIKDTYSIEDGMKNKIEAQNVIAVEGENEETINSDTFPRNNEENLTKRLNSQLNKSESDYDSSATSVSELQYSKRKCSPDNCESDNCSKRVKSSRDLYFEGQSGNGSSSSERFFNLQAGRESAASNPDFSRAISSILPNFQGLDIPSFIWQKQEMGCAIVDNVFNRTLEEMGLSPDPVVNMNASTRLTLENHSIETAIRNQGLRASGSQSEERRILDSMETIQQNATMQDFQHTQNQISMIVNVAQSQSPVNVDHAESKLENSAMNCQVLDHDSCDTDQNKNQLVQHSTIVNCLDLNKVNVTTTATGHSKNICKNLDTIKVACDENDISLSVVENSDCVSMEDSHSSQCSKTTDKHTETVLDLAVSTAILNQGLTFESS